jgi:hypothetical protein
MFIKILPGDDDTQRMLKERHNAAIRGLQLSEYQYDVGTTNVGLVLTAARSVLEARLALAKTPEEQIRARQDYLDFVISYWKRAKAKLDIGGATGFSPIDEAQAREAMYDAKLKLAQALPPKPSKEPATSPNSPDAASSPAPKPGPTPAPSRDVRTTAGRVPEASPAWLTAKPLEAGTNDDELQKLLKARYNAALKSLQGHLARTEIDPTVSMTPVIAAAHTVLDADLAITAPKDTVGAYQHYLEFMRHFDDVAGTRWKNGSLGSDEVNAAHEARLDAEIKLMQAKFAVPSSPQKLETAEPPIHRLALQSLETRVRIAEAEVVAARAAVGQSEAELKRALVNLKYRQLQFDRLQSLRKQNAVSEGGMEDAIRARDEAAASVDGARSTIEAAKAQVSIKEAQSQQARIDLDSAKAVRAK